MKILLLLLSGIAIGCLICLVLFPLSISDNPTGYIISNVSTQRDLDSTRHALEQYRTILPSLTLDSLQYRVDTLAGDINKDGRLTESDLFMCIEIFLYARYIDADTNGVINFKDMRHLIEYYRSNGPAPAIVKSN